jgi:hypothetical protein
MIKRGRIVIWKLVDPATLRFIPTGEKPIDDDLKFLVVAIEGGADDWGAYLDTRHGWSETDVILESDAHLIAGTGMKLRRSEAAGMFPLFNPERYRD